MQSDNDEADDDGGEPSMMNKLAVVIYETPPSALKVIFSLFAALAFGIGVVVYQNLNPAAGDQSVENVFQIAMYIAAAIGVLVVIAFWIRMLCSNE